MPINHMHEDDLWCIMLGSIQDRDALVRRTFLELHSRMLDKLDKVFPNREFAIADMRTLVPELAGELIADMRGLTVWGKQVESLFHAMLDDFEARSAALETLRRLVSGELTAYLN